MRRMGRMMVPVAALVAAVCWEMPGCATDTSGRSGEPKGTLSVPADLAAKYEDPRAASELREQALDLLTAMIKDPNPQLRANAIEAMSATPVRLQALIAPTLSDENAGVRSTAAMMVGKVQMREIAPALRPLLTDSSPFARASAIYGLSRCGAAVDLTPMAQMLLGDPSPRVRSHVAYLLGEMGDPSALGLLHEAARATMPRAAPAEVRLMQLQLAEAMVKLGDESQVATIRAALYPSRVEDFEATALAVQIIGQLRDKGSMDELILLSAKRTKTGQPWPAEIRLGVAGALAHMGLDKGTFIADEYASNPMAVLRAQAAYVYGEIGRPENLAKLDLLMRGPEGIVRVSAAAAVLRLTSNPNEQASAWIMGRSAGV
jgi:HEAT repeat protein